MQLKGMNFKKHFIINAVIFCSVVFSVLVSFLETGVDIGFVEIILQIISLIPTVLIIYLITLLTKYLVLVPIIFYYIYFTIKVFYNLKNVNKKSILLCYLMILMSITGLTYLATILNIWDHVTWN